jgi:hypothetical protein
MTTTAFQYVFDNAESISINRRAVTAQTIARDNTVRTISRGGQIWRFDVKLPDGPRWTDLRPYVEAIDYADRYTVGTVQLDNAGYNDWMTPYLGNSANYTAFAASWTQGATAITLTSSPTTTSGFKFRTGDFIQLGTGRVYSVVADVPFNSNTVNLNRAVIDNTGSGALAVAENVTWSVVCTELPQWTIFARNQVSWSGNFVFYEYML